MRLTNQLLKRIVESERREMLQESRLRETIRRHIRLVLEGPEGDEKPAKAGSQTASAEGTINVDSIAKTLDLDATKLKTAVTNLRAGKRNSNDNQVFGDMIAKLIDASPEDTVKVMGVLKKVEAEGTKPGDGTDSSK